MLKGVFIGCLFLVVSCKSKIEKTKPALKSITESVYASGIIKSKDQYQAFVSVNGIIKEVFVKEGDAVKKGTPILSISNETQRLNKENAELARAYASIDANKGKLDEALLFVQLSKNKMKNDSLMYVRQQNLWKQQVGTRAELEQKELAYENSKNSYFSAKIKYADLKRQLDFSSNQSQKNLSISQRLEQDYTLTSEIDGVVYSLLKSRGEIVSPQVPIAVIGSAKEFLLELQVDEYDILKIKKGQKVLVRMDSYKDQVFEARVSHIDPFMNERSRTFLVEAIFDKQPSPLYPNITFEANIVLNTKKNALLVPRNYLVNDSFVVKVDGSRVPVKTGMKDYQQVEILSGIGITDELQKPSE